MNRRVGANVTVVVMLIAVMSGIPANEASAQQSVDSIATAIRVKTLASRRAELRKRIQEEDAKRGHIVEGITPDANERLNTTQDSICLSLRSQLVSVELELAEVSPGTTQEALARKLDILRKRAADTSADTKEQ